MSLSIRECSEVPAPRSTADARPRQMSGSVETATSIVGRGDEPLTADRILKQLDVMRRLLAISWFGSQGAFAGYDRIQINAPFLPVSGPVSLSARLVEACGTSHVVELRAWIDPSAHGESALGRRAVLIEGVGRTLHVQTSAEPGERRSGRTPTTRELS